MRSIVTFSGDAEGKDINSYTVQWSISHSCESNANLAYSCPTLERFKCSHEPTWATIPFPRSLSFSLLLLFYSDIQKAKSIWSAGQKFLLVGSENRSKQLHLTFSLSFTHSLSFSLSPSLLMMTLPVTLLVMFLTTGHCFQWSCPDHSFCPRW